MCTNNGGSGVEGVGADPQSARSTHMIARPQRSEADGLEVEEVGGVIAMWETHRLNCGPPAGHSCRVPALLRCQHPRDNLLLTVALGWADRSSSGHGGID